MQLTQLVCVAAQGDACVWSHEPDCADTAPGKRLAGALGGRGVIQMDLDRLERWARKNLTRFNKANRKVLHPDWGNSKCKYSLGEERIERSGEGHDGVGQEDQHDPAMHICIPDS